MSVPGDGRGEPGSHTCSTFTELSVNDPVSQTSVEEVNNCIERERERERERTPLSFGLFKN